MRSKKETTKPAADWPRIEVAIHDDGTGEVRIAGTVAARLDAGDAATARQEAIGHLTAAAQRFDRPVRASTRDPQGEWAIVVAPDGTVRAADTDPGRAPKRARKARTTPAPAPASRKREGADTSGRGVPPTGHDRDPRPPFILDQQDPAVQQLAAQAAQVADHEAQRAKERAAAAARVARERAQAEQAAAERVAVEQAAAERQRVDDAVHRWETFRTDLEVAVEQGRALLSASDGQVGDDSLTPRLVAALADAAGVLTTAMPGRVEDLDAPIEAGAAAASRLRDATAATAVAREAWEAAEAERVAAEREEAERAEAARNAAERARVQGERRAAAQLAEQQEAAARAPEAAELAAAERTFTAASDELEEAIAAAARTLRAAEAAGLDVAGSLGAAAGRARNLRAHPAPGGAVRLLVSAGESAIVARDLHEVRAAADDLVRDREEAQAPGERERTAEAAAARVAAEEAVREARAARAAAASAAADALVEQTPVASDVVHPGEGDRPELSASEVPRSAAQWWRRARTWFVLAVVVLLAAGGGVAWHVLTERELVAAHAQWKDERLALTDEIQAAQDVADAAEGKVADAAVLEHLQRAISAALEARADPSAGGGAKGSSTGAWHAAERDLIAAGAVLRAAVDAVTEQRDAWELARAAGAWEQARTELSAAVDEASSVVASAAGQVADDAVRQVLAEAIAAASATRDQDVDAESVDALDGAAAAASSARDSLAGPTQAVRDAQAAWLAEQERVAAANAAAARQPSQAGSAASQGSTTPAGSKAPPATGSKAPAAAAPPSSGGGGGTQLWIRPGSVSCTSRAPYDFSVSATTGGVTGAVVVTIGGASVTIGTGSGSFSGALTGLPAGSYSWSVSADGLVVPGSQPVVVPCPQQ